MNFFIGAVCGKPLNKKAMSRRRTRSNTRLVGNTAEMESKSIVRGHDPPPPPQYVTQGQLNTLETQMTAMLTLLQSQTQNVPTPVPEQPPPGAQMVAPPVTQPTMEDGGLLGLQLCKFLIPRQTWKER